MYKRGVVAAAQILGHPAFGEVCRSFIRGTTLKRPDYKQQN